MLVQNSQQGYGYRYADLASIERAGVAIPPMKLKTDPATGRQRVWAWLTLPGAEAPGWVPRAIVTELKPTLTREGKESMNQAQADGAALTYARRYTLAMVAGIGTTDDRLIEQDVTGHHALEGRTAEPPDTKSAAPPQAVTRSSAPEESSPWQLSNDSEGDTRAKLKAAIKEAGIPANAIKTWQTTNWGKQIPFTKIDNLQAAEMLARLDEIAPF